MSVPQTKRIAWLEQAAVRQYVILAGIICLGAVLRLYQLSTWSFWSDELFTVRNAANVMKWPLFERNLSLVLTHSFLSQLGTTEWSARIAATIIGIATILLLYFPIRRLFNTRIALLTMFLLAISPWHLYWSQNARFYTALLLFFNLALLSFQIGMEEDKPGYLLLSMVFAGLAAMERLVGLAFVPIILIYLILIFVMPYERPPGWRKRNFALFAAVGLIVTALLAMMFLDSISGWFTVFSFVNNNPVWIAAGVVFYMTLPTVMMSLAGAWILFKERNRSGLLLLLTAALPLLVTMLASLIQYSANRYVFISLPSIIILAGVAAVRLLDSMTKENRVLIWAVLGLLFIAPLADNALYYRYHNGNRPNWKEAFAWIETHMEPDDIVAVPERLIGEYYMPGKTKDVAALDLAELTAGDQTVWFVEDLNLEFQRPHVYSWLNEQALIDAVFDVHVQARNFTMRVHKYEPATSAKP